MPEDPLKKAPQDVSLDTDSNDTYQSETTPSAQSPEVERESVLAVEAEPSTNTEMSAEPQVDSDTTEPYPVQSVNSTNTAFPTQSVSQSTPPAPTKKSRKKLVAAVIIAILVVLSVAAVAAYNLWYQQPQKVVLDGIVHALTADNSTARGTFNIENKDLKLGVNFDTKVSSSSAGANASLSIVPKNKELLSIDKLDIQADSVITKSGDAYFKLNNLSAAFDSAVDGLVAAQVNSSKQYGYTPTPKDIKQMKTMLEQMYKPILEKIDNQWLVVKADKTKNDDGNKDTQACLSDTVTKLEKDKKMQRELRDVYQKNTFVSIEEKLGAKNGSLGYEIGYNTKSLDAFMKSAKDTSFGKMLSECDSSAFSDSDDTTNGSSDSKDPFADKSIQIWVSRWSHQITQVKFNATQKDAPDTKYNGDVTTDFTTPVTVDVPKNAKSIDEIMKEIQTIPSGVSPLGV